MQSPLQSFLRFTIGFMVFLSVSFGVTFAVNTISTAQEKERQTASAYEAMVGTD